MGQAAVLRWLNGTLEKALRGVAEGEGLCPGSGKVLPREEAI